MFHLTRRIASILLPMPLPEAFDYEEPEGMDGMDLIREIRAIYDNYDFDTEILAASIRNPAHVTAAALSGADCATIPPGVFSDLFKHPLTEKGLEQFMSDWAKTGQSIL